MRAVVQRVVYSDVSVDDKIIGQIDNGLMVLLGVESGDSDKDVNYIVDKISGLRIFEDETERMNLSVKDINGKVLIISQFTLLGDVRKGKRPSFTAAERPDMADMLYEKVVQGVRQQGLEVQTGQFQADMLVKIHNDGPVTILLDSHKLF